VHALLITGLFLAAFVLAMLLQRTLPALPLLMAVAGLAASLWGVVRGSMGTERFWAKQGRPRYFVESFVVIGKWATGLGGAALGGSIAFGIGAYTAMQTNCVSHMFSIDALDGAAYLAKLFLRGSALAISASILPFMIGIIHQTAMLIMKEPYSYGSDLLAEIPSGILAISAFIQFIFIMLSLGVVGIGMYAAIFALDAQAIGRGQDYWKSLEASCEAMSRAP